MNTRNLVSHYETTYTDTFGSRRIFMDLTWDEAKDTWDNWVSNAPNIASATLWEVNPHHQRKCVYRLTRAQIERR